MQNIDDRRSGSWEQCDWSKIEQQVSLSTLFDALALNSNQIIRC